MSTRIVTTALSALLLIGSSIVCAAEEKPPQGAKQTDEAQMKKHCDDMMKGKDMSNNSAEHEAMMKKCREMMKEKGLDRTRRSARTACVLAHRACIAVEVGIQHLAR